MLKYLLIVSLLYSTLGASQSDSCHSKLEADITAGYKGVLGYFGLKAGYSPYFCSNAFQGSVAVDFSNVSKLSFGLNICPLKFKLVNPYLGADYAFGLPATFSEPNGTFIYKVGVNKYLGTYLGFKIKLGSEYLNLKIESGYLFLLNPPNVTLVAGSVSDFIKYKENFSGGPIVNVLICFSIR